MLTYILAGVAALVLLAVDQITKYYIAGNFVLGHTETLLPGVLNLSYIHNNGGAWGILGGYTWLLLALTAAVMIICITLLVTKGAKNPFLFWAGCLVLSGGVGNMIDRVLRGGNVIDFLQFDFWRSFPVFNIADCCIVVGCGILIAYFIWDSIEENRKKKQKNNAAN